MGHKKLKFRPVITRVRLNPEQAVLACSCYSGGWQLYLANDWIIQAAPVTCKTGPKSTTTSLDCVGGGAKPSGPYKTNAASSTQS